MLETDTTIQTNMKEKSTFEERENLAKPSSETEISSKK